MICFISLFVVSLAEARCCCFTSIPTIPTIPTIPWLLDYQPSGIYISAFGGMNGGYELDNQNVHLNRGYYAGINIGKKVLPNFRLEADAIWQENDVNGLIVGNISLDHAHGTINTYSFMGNAVLDLNFPYPGSPSIGGGVGYGNAEGHWSGTLSQTVKNITASKKIKSSFHKNGLCWQIIADLNFFLCPNLKINIEYRFFKLENKFSNNKFGLTLVRFF